MQGEFFIFRYIVINPFSTKATYDLRHVSIRDRFRLGKKFKYDRSASTTQLENTFLLRFSDTMNSTTVNRFVLFNEVSWMAVYICVAVLIIAGNSVTIFIFLSIRKQLKRTSYLLINLAIADFLVGVALVLWLCDGIASMTGVRLSHTLFETVVSLEVTGILSSILSLTLISLERMLAIVWPFRHRVLSTQHYCVSIGSVWMLSCLNAIVNIDVGSAYSLLTVFTIIMSVVVISSAYLAIWISRRRNQLPNNSSRTMERNRKLAQTLFMVSALSIITCLPNGIVLALRDYILHLHSFGVQIIIVVQYANSFLNPVLYCLKMPEFKRSLKKLLCSFSRQNYSVSQPSSVTSHPVTIMKAMKAIETP